MQENDTRIVENPAEFLLLFDTNTYLTLEGLYAETGIDAFALLEKYPKVDYFLSNAVINELIKGPQGVTSQLLELFKRSLEDEMVGNGGKDNRVLYNSKDGTVRVAELNNISQTDHGQILLCQNHEELILVTSDHKMQKTAIPLLDRRIMDIQGMLDFFAGLTPDKQVALQWQSLLDQYVKTSGYKRPQAVRMILDRTPGKKHKFIP